MSATAPRQTSSSLIARRDLVFLLHEWLEIERLAERPAFAAQSRDLYDEVLALAGKIATEKFAPHNRDADEHEPHVGAHGTVELVPAVGEALRAFSGAGLGGTSMPETVGGLGLPAVLSTAAFSYFQAANAGTAGYAMLTMAAANLLLANGSPEQIDRYVKPMVEGRFFGTMCLSETQAGSSLTDIATRAEAQHDGTFRLFGTKMWISGGEHELGENIIHLVLAKIVGGPEGVKGISLFLVPRRLVTADGSLGEPNDVVLAGLNHKMGYRGTVNTVLGFGEGEHRPGGAAGAVGYLVGEEHSGLAAMFHMMNEARVGVGLGATALGYTGYLKSLRYARERPQGRPVTAKDPEAPQIPIIEHADVKRMLLAQKSYVEGALALMLYCAKLVDDERTLEDADARRRAHLLLELLTPIAKSWPSQWCLEANSLAIQVHGGYGYAREYEVEQHYRDNRLNPIHEGTHGVQALDLLGRKVTMQGGAALGQLADAMAATVERARAAGGDAGALAEPLQAALTRLLEVTGVLWADGAGGAEVALANATTYLEAVGHVVVAWMWLEQLVAAGSGEGPFYEGKRQAPGSSSATSFRRPGRSSTCSRPRTARRSTCVTPGSGRDRRAQRRARAVHDRPRGHRRLLMTAAALPQVAPRKHPRLAATARRADEPVRPPRRHQVLKRRVLRREPVLQLRDRARKLGQPMHQPYARYLTELDTHHLVLYDALLAHGCR